MVPELRDDDDEVLLFTLELEERPEEERELFTEELLRPVVVPDDLKEELLPELRVAVVSREERVDELRSDEELLRPLVAAEDR